MPRFVTLKAFAYRLASAALRVGVVLTVALPLVVMATRPWLNSDQIANESSGKRPSAVRLKAWEFAAATPQKVVDTSGNTAGAPSDCLEVAVQNDTGVEACLWFVANGAACASSGGIDCGVSQSGFSIWQIKNGSAYVTRMPATDSTNQSWQLCVEPAAIPATALDLVYVSCLAK